MKIPNAVMALMDCLQAHNYEAYVVGGCVRDSLLGFEPHDWDICTSASPQEMLTVFNEYTVLQTGLKHGTVTVMMNGEPIEITAFRTEGAYCDHRHPETVCFVKTLTEDLARRDFTVNAMAYHPSVGLCDPFGGKNDLAAGVLRCVGNPKQRFEEDALRILRALRFAAAYGFDIESETALALHDCSPLLTAVSAERVQAELCRMLTGNHVGEVLEKHYSALFPVLPELKATEHFEQFSPYHDRDVLAHTIAAVQNAAPDITVRLTLLLHDLGKPFCFSRDEEGHGHFFGHAKIGEELANTILKRLRFDAKTINDVCLLIRYHDTVIERTDAAVRRWLNRLGEYLFEKLLLVKEGDCKGHSAILLEPRMAELTDLRSRKERIIQEKQCFSLRDLAVDGTDILKLGVPAGKKVGELLQWALQEVMEQRLPNQKEVLLSALAKKS